MKPVRRILAWCMRRDIFKRSYVLASEHTTSLKNLPSPTPRESLPYWFQGNFAATFVLNYRLKEFLLSVFADCFELKCEPKQLT